MKHGRQRMRSDLSPTVLVLALCAAAQVSGAVAADAARSPAEARSTAAKGLAAPDPRAGTPVVHVPATRVVSGRFANVAGHGLGGLTVAVYLSVSATKVEPSYRAPLLGRTTTAADGSWKLTLAGHLSAPVRAAAAANGGVLNVVANVAGVAADGMPMLGSQYVPVSLVDGVAAAKVASLGSPLVVPASALYPAGHRTSTRPVVPAGVMAPSSTAAARLRSAVASPSLYQTSDGRGEPANFHPAMAGGVDYANVVPLDNPCWALPMKLLKTSVSYSTVGEAHAYSHAKAAFDYHGSMSTYLSAVVDFGDGPVVLSGGGFLNAHGGVGVGITAIAAPFGRQYRVPVRYNKNRYGSHCVHGGDTYWIGITPVGYSAPAGGKTSQLGRNVLSADGPASWRKCPPAWRVVVTPGTYLRIDYNTSVTYTGAASVFGIGIRATTSYDTDHSQTYYADSSSYRHNAWGGADAFGYNANGTLRDPKVIYSW